MRARQEFGRQIRDDFGTSVRVGNRVHRRDVAIQQAVADRVGERHVPVVARRVSRKLGLVMVQVFDQRGGDGIRAESGAHSRRVSLALGPVLGCLDDSRFHSAS
jgi:hypothetical protein